MSGPSSSKRKGGTRSVMAPDLLLAAKTRWLNVIEILYLLGSEQGVLHLRTDPPDSPPESGELFLYDRSVTRNYKADGHEWIRKRNCSKVREDHVKLRVKGVNLVAGCYVHSSTIDTLHRRAYHILGDPTRPSSFGKEKSIVLVHYLDTAVAASQKSLDRVPSQTHMEAPKDAKQRHEDLSLKQPPSLLEPKFQQYEQHGPPLLTAASDDSSNEEGIIDTKRDWKHEKPIRDKPILYSQMKAFDSPYTSQLIMSPVRSTPIPIYRPKWPENAQAADRPQDHRDNTSSMELLGDIWDQIMADETRVH